MNRITVALFQRKARPDSNFSLEQIFADLRQRLSNRITFELKACRFYNDGFLSIIINTIEAGLRQTAMVNHVTGELHFLCLLMNKKKTILTILDCGMIHRKKGITRFIVKWLYLGLPVRRCRFITAISESTKLEIVTYARCSPDKIDVIPVAVHPIYTPVPRKFSAHEPNVLHVGVGPNKNLLRLIKALEGIRCHLTIVGKLSEEYLEELRTRSIVYTEKVNLSVEEMFREYVECDILAFVSTFEGFGMPIVEANCVERVVLTSNISSMPEVADNAAHLVDPYDIADIQKGIITLITDSDYRELLLSNGRMNKLRFNPNIIADSYFDLYTRIAEAH